MPYRPRQLRLTAIFATFCGIPGRSPIDSKYTGLCEGSLAWYEDRIRGNGMGWSETKVKDIAKKLWEVENSEKTLYGRPPELAVYGTFANASTHWNYTREIWMKKLHNSAYWLTRMYNYHNTGSDYLVHIKMCAQPLFMPVLMEKDIIGKVGKTPFVHNDFNFTFVVTARDTPQSEPEEVYSLPLGTIHTPKLICGMTNCRGVPSLPPEDAFKLTPNQNSFEEIALQIQSTLEIHSKGITKDIKSKFNSTSYLIDEAIKVLNARIYVGLIGNDDKKRELQVALFGKNGLPSLEDIVNLYLSGKFKSHQSLRSNLEERFKKIQNNLVILETFDSLNPNAPIEIGIILEKLKAFRSSLTDRNQPAPIQ